MNKMIVNILILIAASNSFAQNKSQTELIDHKRRPGVTEILSNQLNYEPYSTSDIRYLDSSAGSKVTAIDRYLPQLIVSLEKAFPGGTYGFLGRDMDLIADAVEVYYKSIGQNNRVKKIEFSTPSLTGSTPELMTEFLVQLGLESGQRQEKGAFVIIDYTSYGTTGRTSSSYPSQARHIFQSAIAALKKSGLSSEQIVSRLNLATIDSAAQNNVIAANPLNDSFKDFLNLQAKSLKSSGAVDRVAFLDVGGDSMAYHSEWNDKYGPIARDSNGKLKTEPGSYFSFQQKNGVFNYMVKAINIALSAKMKERISDLAIKYGVNFSAGASKNGSQIKKLNAVKIDYEAQFKANIKTNLANLSELPSEKQYEKVKLAGTSVKLTENGSEVIQVLANSDAIQSAHYFEISFTTLKDLFLENKIGARDFRRIFAYILSLKPINSAAFVTMVMKEYKNILPLEIMFGREEERTKYLAQGGIGESNYKLLTQDGKLNLSCRFSYSN